MAILVNSFTLVGIAIDRYLAIVRWIKGTWEPSTLFCGACAVFVWGLAAGISSPMMSSYYIAEFFIIATDPNNRSHMIDVAEAEMCTSEKVNRTFLFLSINDKKLTIFSRNSSKKYIFHFRNQINTTTRLFSLLFSYLC